MPSLVVDLQISAERFLAVYRGQARTVTAVARDGRTVRFPAENLRPFVTREGVEGSFLIAYAQDGKLQSLRRLEE